MSNISIRVRLPEAPDEYVVKEERIILWDRILGVVFMAIIALAAVYFVFIFDWSVSENQATSNPEIIAADDAREVMVTDTSTENAQAFAEPPLVELKETDLKDETLAQAAESVDQSALEKRESLNPKQAEMAASNPVDIKEQKAKTLPAAKLNVAVKPEVIIENTALKQTLAPATTVKKLATKNAEVHVHSPKVKSAIITREMKNRAPGAALADVVDVAEGELLTVYFYTEFDGLAKQALHFDWFQNGKRRARVKIRPIEENIGSYSSKYITHRMTGDWSVKVSTAAGEKLASAKFKVVN